MAEVDKAGAAQSASETQAFIEAFARVTVLHIREQLGSPLAAAAEVESKLTPDWDDPAKLMESGADTVMITRLVDKRTEERYAPGSNYAVSTASLFVAPRWYGR